MTVASSEPAPVMALTAEIELRGYSLMYSVVCCGITVRKLVPELSNCKNSKSSDGISTFEIMLSYRRHLLMRK